MVTLTFEPADFFGSFGYLFLDLDSIGHACKMFLKIRNHQVPQYRLSLASFEQSKLVIADIRP